MVRSSDFRLSAFRFQFSVFHRENDAEAGKAEALLRSGSRLTKPSVSWKRGRMKTLTPSLIAFFACGVLALTALGGPEPIDYKSSKEVAPAPSCDYIWTGFYIGANLGYGLGDADTRFEPLPDAASFFALEPRTLHPDPAGVIGGAQIGYNHQWGKFVLGAEADFQGSGMDGTDRFAPIVDINGVPDAGTFLEARERTDWFGTARVRVGFTPVCRLLVYATGGLAYGDVNYSAITHFNTIVYPTSFDRVKAGWTAGGGLEYALTRRWSLKAEYLYYDLGDESSTANGAPLRPPYQVHYNWDTTAHIARAGLNFKF